MARKQPIAFIVRQAAPHRGEVWQFDLNPVMTDKGMMGYPVEISGLGFACMFIEGLKRGIIDQRAITGDMSRPAELRVSRTAR